MRASKDEEVVLLQIIPHPEVRALPSLEGCATGEIKYFLGDAAKILVIVHMLAALKHQLWDKDGLLSRMRPM